MKQLTISEAARVTERADTTLRGYMYPDRTANRTKTIKGTKIGYDWYLETDSLIEFFPAYRDEILTAVVNKSQPVSTRIRDEFRETYNNGVPKDPQQRKDFWLKLSALANTLAYL